MVDQMLSPARAMPMAAAKLQAHAASHQFVEADIHWSTPFDRSAWCVCPTLTPLYHTPVYATLTHAHRLRYNQLVGLCTNEIVGMFERTLQTMVGRLQDEASLPADVRGLLAGFIADEERHADIWAKLNRLAEPAWYASSEVRMVRLTSLATLLIAAIGHWPAAFPVSIWTVLALEEHSLEIGRRTMKADVQIEPRFLAAYRFHAQDEARHIQIDWQVLEHLLARLSPMMLRLNVRLFRALVDRFLLRPVNVAASAVRQLGEEFTELSGQTPAMLQALEKLSTSASYREMIFSRRSNPVTFGLIDRIAPARAAFEALGGQA